MSCKQTRNRGLFRIKLVTNNAWENHDFWWVPRADVSFQWALELLHFELCGQSYGPFTEAYAEYIETGSIFEQWTLRKNWYWLAYWKMVIFGTWIDHKLSFNFFLNHLNPNFVEKVMIILLRLHRLNWNCAHLCSNLIWGPYDMNHALCPK